MQDYYYLEQDQIPPWSHDPHTLQPHLHQDNLIILRISPVIDAQILEGLLTLRLGLIGRIDDYLLSTDGASSSANSKRQFETPEVLCRLLENGPTPSVRFLEIEFDLSGKGETSVSMTSGEMVSMYG